VSRWLISTKLFQEPILVKYRNSNHFERKQSTLLFLRDVRSVPETRVPGEPWSCRVG